MAIQTTLSFEDPKLISYMEMYEALYKADEEGLPTDHNDMSNGYVYDLQNLFFLWRSGIQVSNTLYSFSDTTCFYCLEQSYKKYILKE